LFIYFNDFINEECLDLDSFILANRNLFSPYKKTKSNSGKHEKKEKTILTKIFEILNRKYVKNKNNNLINQMAILRYCLSLGINETNISNIYTFIDKIGTGKIEINEFKLFLSSFLEFYYFEHENNIEKKNNKDLDDANDNWSENKYQDKIEKIIEDFVEIIDFKKYKNLISKENFIKIFSQNKDLKDEILSIIEKTQESIFSRVFKINLNVEEILINFNKLKEEGNELV